MSVGKTIPEHMALPLELKNIALQLQDDLEAARIARDALRERAEALLVVLDRDGLWDWQELDDARNALRDALK